MCNILPIKGFLKGDLINGRICSPNCRRNVISQSDNTEYAAAIRYELARFFCGTRMKDKSTHALSNLDAADFMPLFIGGRITTGRDDDTDRSTVLPTNRYLCKAPIRAGTHDLYEISIEKRQHDLRFRIAKACIKLDDLWAVRCNHKAGIKATAIEPPLLFHRCYRRF